MDRQRNFGRRGVVDELCILKMKWDVIGLLPFGFRSASVETLVREGKMWRAEMRSTSEIVTLLRDSVVNVQDDLDMNPLKASSGQMRLSPEPSSEYIKSSVKEGNVKVRNMFSSSFL